MKRLLILLALPFVVFLNGCEKETKTAKDITSIAENALDSLVDSKQDSVYSRVGIKMTKRGGVYELPCTVNGVKMNFIFDTGASDVCLSTTEARFLYKNGYLDDTDFLGESYSQIADGSIVENMEILLKTVEIEGLIINNVRATVVRSLDAPLLLGQTAIQKFGRIEFAGDSLYITSSIKQRQGKTNSHEVEADKSGGRDESVPILFGNNRNKKVTQLLSDAIRAYNKSMPELAEENCRKAISINKKDWRSYALLGVFYYDNRTSKKDAITAWEEYISLNKNRTSFEIEDWFVPWKYVASCLAYAYADYGKYEEAITLAQTVLVENPDYKYAMDALSLTYTEKRNYEKAEFWANKLKDIDEGKGLFRLGYLYSRQGRTSEAIKVYIKYLEINPDDSAAMSNLALCYASYFKDEEHWYKNDNNHKKYYNTISNKEYYWETVRLHIKAARLGNKNSQEWLKKRELEW